MRLSKIELSGCLVVTAALVGCGGRNSTAAQPAATPTATTGSSHDKDSDKTKDKDEVATGNTLTEFQKGRLLGHYSTENGDSGFILDRTVTPWRAKLDGTNTVVTMTKTNTPRRGEEEYTSEDKDKTIWIRLNVESGQLLFFQGPKQREAVRITRDANADQLK